jgi:predicted ester cyclase
MLQTIRTHEQLLDDYQDLIAGIYVSLMRENGKIGGFDVSVQNRISPLDFSEAEGVKTLIRFFGSVNYAFPQYTLNIEHMITKGEKVMARYTVTGVPTSRIMGIEPAKKLVRINASDLFRLNQGKLVAYWNLSRQIELA